MPHHHPRYGGQEDGHDFHRVGFDEGLLGELLVASGFCHVVRVMGPFGLFDDTSAMDVFGEVHLPNEVHV